jgi:hypothetical protein
MNSLLSPTRNPACIAEDFNENTSVLQKIVRVSLALANYMNCGQTDFSWQSQGLGSQTN